MVNQNFKARGQYLHSCLFFCVCAFVGFCVVVQILISQMNTNIYSVSVCAPVTSDAFQPLRSLLEQQVATPRHSAPSCIQPANARAHTHVRLNAPVTPLFFLSFFFKPLFVALYWKVPELINK